MPQPNKGGHGTPNVAAPIMDKTASAPKGGEVHFGNQPGGTHGSKK
jgi:hypothetical protein